MNVILALMALAAREGLSLVLEPRSNYFAVILRRDGTLLDIVPRDDEIQTPLTLPRTSGIRPNILFDSAKYVLEDGPARDASLALHESLLAKCPRHPGLRAIVNFLSKRVTAPKDLKITSMLVYFLEGETSPICEDQGIADIIRRELEASFDTAKYTPLYGEGEDSLTAVHPKVALRGMTNGQALITNDVKVATVIPTDHCMLQSPMSFDAVMAYSVALRWLSKGRALCAWSVKPLEVSIFLWTEVRHPLEEKFAGIFSGHPKGMLMADWRASISEWLDDPSLDSDMTPTNILFLGASSRIAVRKAEVRPMAEVVKNLRRFVRTFHGHPLWEIFRLPQVEPLLNTARIECWMSAILLGGPFPSIPTVNAVALRRLTQSSSKADYSTRLLQILFDATHQETMQEPTAMYLIGRLYGVCLSHSYAAARTRGDNPGMLRSKGFATQLAKFPAWGYPKVKQFVEINQGKDRMPRPFNQMIKELEHEIFQLGGWPRATTPQQQCEFHAGVAAWDSERRAHYEAEMAAKDTVEDTEVDTSSDLYTIE